MAINIFSPVFKFASIRNPKPMKPTSDTISVMPDTTLIQNIVAINESNSTNAQKLIKRIPRSSVSLRFTS